MVLRSLVMLSMHTSPLAQAGMADAGGMNVYVREVAAALARRGASCHVYTRRDSPDQPDRIQVEPGFWVHHVKAGPERPLKLEELDSYWEEFAGAVRRSIETELDLVQAIHANYWLSAAAGHRLKHELGIPLACSFHTLERLKRRSGLPGEPNEARAEAEEAAIRCADVVLATSRAEAGALVDYYGAAPDKVALVRPGVDHAFFGPGPKWAARRAVGEPNGTLLLFVGRIQPLKRPEVAVGVLADLPADLGARLAIIGGPSGPEGEASLASLKRSIQELGLEARVRILPPLPHQLLSCWYRASDLCLVPSVSESYGLVALEASASGLPVVASDVDGLRDVVVSGLNGYLVPPGEPASFVAAAIRILKDPEEAARLSRGGVELAREATWSHTAAALEEVLGALERSRLADCRC